MVDVVVEYWMQNVDHVRHWKRQLHQARKGSLLISRIAEFDALQTEFEFLLNCQAASR